MCKIRSEKIVRNKILKAYLLKAEAKLHRPFFWLLGFWFVCLFWGCFVGFFLMKEKTVFLNFPYNKITIPFADVITEKLQIYGLFSKRHFSDLNVFGCVCSGVIL